MIYGEASVKKRAANAAPGDKTVYVNWEAISELPDEFEAIVTEIRFDPKDLSKDFSNVGTSNAPSWMPNPDMMYRIAEACGIRGGDHSIVEPIIENIDINPMLCKPMDAEPTIRHMKTGERVVKYGERLQEDGTLQRSSACTIDYNVWDRCLEAWTKEEQRSDGYSTPGKYPFKYDNMYKRRAHFQSELKFAHAKAETKAHLKAIRELASLMTGYKNEDLQSGSMIFSRVRRSRKIMQAETAAHLARISSVRPAEAEPQALLFGTTTEPEISAKAEEIPHEEKNDSRKILIDLFNNYLSGTLIPEKIEEGARAVLKWLKENEDAESNAEYWTAAISRLKKLEEVIPSDKLINHVF